MYIKLKLQLKILDQHKQTPQQFLDSQGKISENTKI